MSIKFNTNRIKYEMKEQGLTVERMAEILGCSEQSVYNLLCKKDIPTFAERAILICYMLALNPLDVFELKE